MLLIFLQLFGSLALNTVVLLQRKSLNMIKLGIAVLQSSSVQANPKRECYTYTFLSIIAFVEYVQFTVSSAQSRG